MTRDSVVALADGAGVVLCPRPVSAVDAPFAPGQAAGQAIPHWASPGSVRLVREGLHEVVTPVTERALLAELDPRGGPRPVVDVLAAATAGAARAGMARPAAAWWSALSRLRARGVVLIDESPAHPAPSATDARAQAPATCPVTIVVAGDSRGATGDGFRAALAAAAPGLPQAGDGPPVHVVLTADLTSRAARTAYDVALAAGAWVLPIGLGQHTVRLGPLLGADRSGPADGGHGCALCLVRSLLPGASTDPPHDVALGWSGDAERAAGMAAADRLTRLLSAPAGLAAHGAALRWELVVLDLRGTAAMRHRLTRFPTCARCGARRDDHQAAPGLARLRPTPVDVAHGYRSLGAAEFAARLEPFVDPRAGIVSALRESSQATGGHVAQVDHRVRTGAGWTTLPAMGRGSDAAQARASALGEAVERYSVSWHGDEPARRGTLRDLGEDGLDPAEWLLHSEDQDDAPRRLGLDEQVDLLPLRSLTTGRVRWAPASTLLFGHPGPSDIGAPDSNGCAAAATWPEAVLHGLLELVERDAVSLWWYPRAPRPALDPSILDPGLRRRTDDAVRGAGREWWLLDLTHDLGIPVVAAVSRRVDAPEEAVVFGFGAHLDVAAAAARALGELDQMLAVGPDTDAPGAPPEARAFWAEARIGTHPYLRPHAEAPRSPARVRPSGDAAADVRAVVALLGEQRIEVLAHDSTRPEVGVPVARVLAPGLRHLDRRLGPGRLHDVPARLGWVPPGPRELNPVWLFV